MNAIASLISRHTRWAWSLIVVIGLLSAAAVWKTDVHYQQLRRLSSLQTEALRSAMDVSSNTLNGNLMGSLTLLGLIDMDIKQDAQNGLLSVNASIDGTLAALGASFEAEGVFVVAGDGIIKTSWDRAGKPSTGLDVKFRPYYQMAMQGKSNVYAAVSMARGDRALYFTAPVYAERAKSTSGVGAIVARTNLDRVDKLLQDRFASALLLSPQGVVFASNRQEWIGQLEGAVTPQRVKAIRDLRQFGPLFEKNEPTALAVAARDGVQTINGIRYAVATAEVDWRDPSGPWRLVVLEDLTESAALETSAWRAATATLALWLLCWLVMHLFESRYAQMLASNELREMASQQTRELAFRRQLGEAMVRLQQCQCVPDLGQTFLSNAHTLFGVLQGVVYARNDLGSASFRLQASFASDTEPPGEISAGEGLLGQCAIEKQIRIAAMGESGFWTLRSGLGSAAPRTLVFAPVIRNAEVLGLVEVALLSEPAQFARESFEEFVHLLGLNLQILANNQQADDSTRASVEVEKMP